MYSMRTPVGILCATMIFTFAGLGQAKYVGVKTCGMCHKAEKQGNQLSVWQKSKHAEAYTTLTGAKADSIAKARGLKKGASESTECLQCHVIGHGAADGLVDKNFNFKDGVQCEACHGAGSGYKSIAVMKDTAKSVAAGLKIYKTDAEIEKLCRTCHNDKSPMFNGFKFDEMWAKIKHAKPKA